MSIIYILHYQESIYDDTDQYYFSDIEKVVEFLQKDKCGLPWQTVIVMQLDTNTRQPVYIEGHSVPYSAFSINRLGKIKPRS